jgi:hypothetical protein
MRRRRVAWLLAVLVAHMWLYHRVPASGFVTDDFLWLEDAGRSGGLFEHALSRQPFGYLRPAFHLLMVGSRACFGLHATALHLLAIACSLASALLMFALLRRATRSAAAGGLAALWLTVHPAQAIAVSWVSSLPSLLATTSGLGALWCWQGWLRRGGRARLLASIALHAAALLAKEEAVVWLLAIVAWSLLHRRGGRSLLPIAAHGALAAGYLWLWCTVGEASAPYLPAGADWWAASVDPLLRCKALWLPRHAVTAPFAELLLLAAAVVWWRRAPRRRAAWLAAAAVAAIALLPSSVGLWGFRWDKLDRLLLPALPAAAFVVGLWVATWRRAPGWRRLLAVGTVVLLLVPFAVRSDKTIRRRLRDADRVTALLAALTEHGTLLREAAASGRTVALVGYAVDWSEERAWIYPSGPARAVAPGLRLLPADRASEADVVLAWNPTGDRFAIR